MGINQKIEVLQRSKEAGKYGRFFMVPFHTFALPWRWKNVNKHPSKADRLPSLWLISSLWLQKRSVTRSTCFWLLFVGSVLKKWERFFNVLFLLTNLNADCHLKYLTAELIYFIWFKKCSNDPLFQFMSYTYL